MAPTVHTNNPNLKLISIFARWKIKNRPAHNEVIIVNKFLCNHKVSEDLSPHGLTSCPDDRRLAAVRAVCSSSCFQPVTKSHINIQNSNLQGMPPTHCDTISGFHSPGDFCVSTLRAADECPSITSAVFSCMRFSILYTYVCTTVVSTMKVIPLPSTLKPNSSDTLK